MIVYAPEIGKVWSVESIDWRVSELDVPWTSLNQELIEKNKHKTIKNKVNNTSVIIPGDIFPMSMEFYPISGEKVIIIVTSPKIAKETWMERSKEIYSVGLASDIVDIKFQENKIEFYELDISTFKINIMEHQDYLLQRLRETGMSHLIRFDGVAIPVPTYTPPKFENFR